MWGSLCQGWGGLQVDGFLAADRHISNQQRRSVLVETALTSGTRGVGSLTDGRTLTFQSIWCPWACTASTHRRLREWTCLWLGSGPLGFRMVTGIVARINKEKVHRAAHKCTGSRAWTLRAPTRLAVNTSFPTPVPPLRQIIRCCFISWK